MASTLIETENKKMRKSNKEMGPHQTYIVLHSKGNNKMKSQPTNWEKISTNNVTTKGLVSKIYKQLMRLISSKQTI